MLTRNISSVTVPVRSLDQTEVIESKVDVPEFRSDSSVEFLGDKCSVSVFRIFRWAGAGIEVRIGIASNDMALIIMTMIVLIIWLSTHLLVML